MQGIGGQVPCLGHGSVITEMLIGNEWKLIQLNEVKYIPGSVNLFSQLSYLEELKKDHSGWYLRQELVNSTFLNAELGLEGPSAERDEKVRVQMMRMRFPSSPAGITKILSEPELKLFATGMMAQLKETGATSEFGPRKEVVCAPHSVVMSKKGFSALSLISSVTAKVLSMWEEFSAYKIAILLLSIALLMPPAISQNPGVLLKANSTIIWERDLRPVATGHQRVQLKLELQTPCDLIEAQVKERTNQTIQMIKICQELYGYYILDEFVQFCEPADSNGVTQQQKKRFVFLLLGVAIVGIASWVGYELYKVHSLESSVADLTEVSKANLAKLEEIEQQIRNNSHLIMELRDDFVHVVKDLVSITQHMDTVREETVRVIALFSQVTAKFIAGQKIIRKMRRDWRNNVLTDELFSFLDVNFECSGKPCDLHLAVPLYCQMGANNRTITLVANIPDVQPEMAVYRVDAFSIVKRRKDGNWCNLEYDGPSYALRNGDCTTFLNHPKFHPRGFIIVPQYDCEEGEGEFEMAINRHKISECRPENKTDWTKIIQVKSSGNMWWVYCPHNTIQTSHALIPCDYSLHAIPLYEKFRVGPFVYTGRVADMKATGVMDVKNTHGSGSHMETITITQDLDYVMQDAETMEEPQPVDFKALEAKVNNIGAGFGLTTHWWIWLIFGGITALIIILMILLYRNNLRIKRKISKKFENLSASYSANNGQGDGKIDIRINTTGAGPPAPEDPLIPGGADAPPLFESTRLSYQEGDADDRNVIAVSMPVLNELVPKRKKRPPPKVPEARSSSSRVPDIYGTIPRTHHSSAAPASDEISPTLSKKSPHLIRWNCWTWCEK